MAHPAATDQPTALPPALDAMTLLVAAGIVHGLGNDQVVLLQRGPHAKFAQGMWDLPVGKALSPRAPTSPSTDGMTEPRNPAKTPAAPPAATIDTSTTSPTPR
jgi:hypothetical protein